MTFTFNDVTVTTWGTDNFGNQIWRARTDQHVAEFISDRNTPTDDLQKKAMQAIAVRVLADGLEWSWNR